jgi:hypothetical protein
LRRCTGTSWAAALASQSPATMQAAARPITPRPTAFGRTSPSPLIIQNPTACAVELRAAVPPRVDSTAPRQSICRLGPLRNPQREAARNKRVKKPRLAVSEPHFAVGKTSLSRSAFTVRYQNTNAGGSAKAGKGAAAASKIGNGLAWPPEARKRVALQPGGRPTTATKRPPSLS